MKKKVTWALPVLGMLATAPLSFADHYKLFVLTGQSNSLGTTAGGESDPTSGSDPADQHIKFFWDNVASATVDVGDSAGAWTTLQDQQGGYWSGSATHWGPEIDFARTLYRAGVEDFGVIKASRGGGGNTHWHKDSSGHMYSHVVDTVTAATNALTADGHTYEIVGMLYVQGESDSSSEAAAAGTRLKELVDNLRADLPNAANMHLVSGGIAAAGGNRNTVRANHSAMADSTAYIDYFDNTDLQPNLYDSLHFDKESKLRLGERFAQTFFGAGVVSRRYGKIAFMGDSITQGGKGDYPSYRYTVFKHLANQGVPIDETNGYKFVGSQPGPYQNSTLTIPDVNGQTFENIHDGHYGWRVFWSNARVALPTGRRSSNRGEGTILNWTGQADPQEYLSSAGTVPYPDPNASGTGNTGGTYIPDVVSIMMGVNDIGDNTGSHAQVIADLGILIDHVRAANPNVRIFLNHILPTNQSAAIQTGIANTNALLQGLADTKNAASSTSPVWVVNAHNGFDPVGMTFDNVHPNADGEKFIGDRIAAALGIVESPLGVRLPENPKDSDEFTTKYDGNDIFDGTSFVNSWSEISGSHTADSLVGDGTDFRQVHASNSSSVLQGPAATWDVSNNTDWTFEARVKVNASPNGYALWLGTDSGAAVVELYEDRTQDNGGGSYNVSHDNVDGAFHTYRVAYDSTNKKYHVWRDGVQISGEFGSGLDIGGSESRLLFGDYTGGTFGGNFDVEIEYVRFDQTGAYTPVVGNRAPTLVDTALSPATVGVAYVENMTTAAADPDAGDTLTFSKVSGPAWLNVATDGTVSGTPTASDVGENTWTLRVTDAGGLTDDATVQVTVSGTTKGSEDFQTKFEGNDIFDGTSFINSWQDQVGANTTETLNGTDLHQVHVNGSASWIEGTNTGWNTANDGDWTYETRLKFNSNSNGYILWLGVDTDRIYVDIQGGRTRDLGAQSFDVEHNNVDGEFHTFRVTHDSAANVYHVWRDGERLTPLAGAGYDNGSNDGRLIMGDYTGGSYGDNYDVEIDYVRFDQTGAFAPLNQTPVFADVTGAAATEGTAYTGSLTASVTDEDAGDTHTFTKVSGPAWLVVNSDGSLGGTPSVADIGSNQWTVRVTDAGGLTADATLTITVADNTGSQLSDAFANKFDGNAIYDGTAYVNGWKELVGQHTTESVVNTDDFGQVHINGSASWIEGTDAGWTTANTGDWTYETRLKFNANANGYALWLGVGTDTILIEIHGGRTQDYGGQAYNVAHNNADGEFHTFRVTHDSTNNVYHLWRDGVRVTPEAGAGYDLTLNENRMIMGDFTGNGTFGDNYDVEIDYVRFDQTGAFTPVYTAPTFADVTGAGATEGVLYAGSVASSVADPDSGDTFTFSKVAGPTWLSVAANGDLSGTPSASDVGTNVWTLRVTDSAGLADEATLQIAVAAAPTATIASATAETTTLGTVSAGTFADVQVNDGVLQSLVEVADGDPATSAFEHQWEFNVTAGSAVTLKVDAFHTANSEGDDFVFAYSTDGTNYTDILTVTKTVDDGVEQTAALPANTSGTVYIRVKDADRTAGNTQNDTIHVDLVTIEVTP